MFYWHRISTGSVISVKRTVILMATTATNKTVGLWFIEIIIKLGHQIQFWSIELTCTAGIILFWTLTAIPGGMLYGMCHTHGRPLLWLKHWFHYRLPGWDSPFWLSSFGGADRNPSLRLFSFVINSVSLSIFRYFPAQKSVCHRFCCIFANRDFNIEETRETDPQKIGRPQKFHFCAIIFLLF